MQLPQNWREILNRPDQLQDLQSALNLLRDSHVVGQYEHIDIRAATKKMIPRFHKPGVYLLSLRVFIHTPPKANSPDIAALFFLRKRVDPLAYCLTIGARPSVQDLEAQLVAICTHMASEPGGGDPVGRLEVVTDINPPDDEPRVADPTANIMAAFRAFRDSDEPPRLDDKGIVPVGDPWPDRVHQWVIVLQ